MENSSKAIIIAGGFFIGVLLISLFMYMLTSFRDFQEHSDDIKDRIEIGIFNDMFREYVTPTSGDNIIKGYQYYNLLGLIAEINSKSDSISYVSINGTEIQDNTYRDSLFYYTEALDKNYTISDIKYSGGVISSITVTE